MKMFTLKHFEWEGRAYRPGQFITVEDHNIAQLMITALRAVDAGEPAAPAPRRTAWPGYTPHATPLRLHR